MRGATAICAVVFSASALSAAGSIEKAVALRSNGLLVEAKKELVEIVFDAESPDVAKAEALLLLGDIAAQEGNHTLASDNWKSLAEKYPGSAFAAAARAKLEVLQTLPAQEASRPPITYPPGTTLVVGPPEYAWAAPQIAAQLRPPTRVFGGNLSEAIDAASKSENVSAIVEVRLAVDVPFEWGRVTCFRSSGAPVWDKSVRVTYPGSEEAIARRFVKKLAERIKGMSCP